jgi:hypothetical protein
LKPFLTRPARKPPSVGGAGDSYDNALAKTFAGAVRKKSHPQKSNQTASGKPGAVESWIVGRPLGQTPRDNLAANYVTA